MLTGTTPWGVWTVVMERMHELEPRIQNFLEGFPCPPPWKEELIFRLNWTSCIGTEMGQRALLYMVDKCKIRAGVMVEEDDDCGFTCPKIIISVASALVFILIFIIVIVYCVRRKRAKAASPSHQSSLTAHADGNAKYYTSCHYACTPVRQIQTSLTGSGTETRVVDSSDSNSLYTPGCYPQHNCQSPVNYGPNNLHHPHHPNSHHHGPHQPHHHYHYPQHPQQPTRFVNTKYGQVPAHTSSLIVPQTSRFNSLSHYRKFDPTYSSSSVSNSDRSPVYESIGDNDSIRERTRNGRENSISECEFCECGMERSHNDHVFYSGYMDLEGRPTSESDTYTDKLGTSGFPPDIEPPCPPLCSDGFYDDRRRSQTLPLRPIRGHPTPTTQELVNGKGVNPMNTPSDILAAQDSNELSPLNQHQQQEPLLRLSSPPPPFSSLPSSAVKENTNNSLIANNNPNDPHVNGNENDNCNNNNDPRIRRRPSSTSSSHYGDGLLSGNGGSQRRPIPALHANYFAPNNTEEIS